MILEPMQLKKRQIIFLLVGFQLFLVLFSCREKQNDPPDDPLPPDDIGKAAVWLTRGDRFKLLDREGDLTIKDTLTLAWPVIKIDTSVTYQEVEGFGAALTGSSAYMLNKKLDQAKRAQVLTDLFSPDTGIGISYLRLTMGASDFSLSDFTYNDLPAGQTDFELEHFSLGQDLDDVVPVLKEILQVNPEMKLMGSPWSPPAWMKTNGNLKGGQLREECYPVYADYFVRYIQQMKNLGITIDAITPQNEPLHFTAGYPCMEMQAEEQGEFIKNHLGPKFASAGINTKIITYDHNWDHPEYGISILDDPDARPYVAGTAFHAYAGYVTAMSTVHSAHPDKGLYFTEISGGEWATDFSENLMWYMENILIGTTRNWSKVALFWNLALNQYHGPQNNGCSDCRGVITINNDNGSVTKNEEYFALGHMSKFVRPGAVRVSTFIPQNLTYVLGVAFQNPDGSKVLVLCNKATETRPLIVNQGGKQFNYTLPQKSVVTIIW